MSDPRDRPCKICGAYSTRACEIEDEDAGIECPWLEVLEEQNSALNAAIDDRVEARRHAGGAHP